MEDAPEEGREKHYDALRSSSTSVRVASLRSLETSIRDGQERDYRNVLPQILATYPYYKDRSSRKLIQTCLVLLCRKHTSCLERLVTFLDTESKKGSSAPSNIFVLTEWSTLSLEVCKGHVEAWNKHGQTILHTLARLLDAALSQSVRRSVRKSILVFVRRSLRGFFKSKTIDNPTKESSILMLADKGAGGTTNTVLLGAIAGVCARLPGENVVRKQRDRYFTFWNREILSSKSLIPRQTANAFNDFWSSYASREDVEKEIAPSLEKGLLRAPEVILNNLVEPMVASLPASVDLSSMFYDHLLKPLLSCVKSSNNSIREGAVSAFSSLMSKCSDSEILAKVGKDIVTTLSSSKLSSIEQRVIHARLLAAMSPSTEISLLICTELLKVLSKEPSEVAAVAEMTALTSHATLCFLQESTDAAGLSEAFVKGIADKRLSIRKLWAVSAADILWSAYQLETSSSAVQSLANATYPAFLDITEEVIRNPVSAAQTGLVSVSFATLALYGLFDKALKHVATKAAFLKGRLLERAMSVDPKPSFLFNQKVYTKLASGSDHIWFLRALESTSASAIRPDTPKAASEAWTQAMLFVLLAVQTASSIRKDAQRVLSATYKKNPPRTAKIIVDGLWLWIYNFYNDVKDTPCQAAGTSLIEAKSVLQSICIPDSPTLDAKLTIDVASLQVQLMSMLGLCQQQLLPNVRWIDLCLRTGQDPGRLVEQHAQDCLTTVYRVISENTSADLASVKSRQAAYDTVAELAFVAPAHVTPLITGLVQKYLDAERVTLFSATDFAIARTPEGTVFVDVLSSTRSRILEKKAKDYDTLKWEEEIKTQLAAKQGARKKMTPDEQAKVNAQLLKEQETRSKVLELEQELRTALGIIKALAEGPPNRTEIWLATSLRCMSAVSTVGAGLLLGDLVDSAYIACARLVTPRLGTLRPFIGVAILRALGSSSMAENLREEPLGELVTRVMYRLRISGEQRSFDGSSLCYMNPLACLILQRAGIGTAEGDAADEQITLALEFLSLHADKFEDPYLQRRDVLSCLIHAMREYAPHYRLAKDCLINLCQALGSNATPDEISILLKGTIVPESNVRNAVLQAIRNDIDLTYLDFCAEIWLACHDGDAENVSLAEAIFEENALEVQAEDAFKIMPYLASQDRALREAASRALARCVAVDESVFSNLLKHLEKEYEEKAKPLEPERDEFGMIKRKNVRDPWEARDGVALTFRSLSATWQSSSLVPFVKFLIDSRAIGDINPIVRENMIQAATVIISAHGGSALEDLMRILEASLEGSGYDTGGSDLVNEAVVILYGALARHLDHGDQRIATVVNRLLETLSTPSETVQYAVASCLPPLVQSSPQKAPEYIQKALDQLLQSKKFATRRGAAYGLAGIVTGKGVGSLREYRIMSHLKAAVESKKDQNARQAALMAYELLSLILGRNFEPYVIQIVPQLLTSFGDPNADVREACLDAAKTCFSRLSSYGVKIILPTLLEGLNESQWRSKKGACDLLGAMAYLDPQQLAVSLPEIIPPLTTVLNDSHKEVRGSANRSLQRFGEVISNPEVRSLVNILLKALSDPIRYTEDALDALIKVSFTHYLDAPSLAMVVRILERGLGDRSGTKRKSAQIIGSLAHLTEKRDLTSHLPILVAGLRVAAVDPVPTTRATASKALGSLVEKLGEDALPDLIPGLMAVLRSDSGAGDRLGSAQALSEVLAGLGTSRLEETLPTNIQN